MFPSYSAQLCSALVTFTLTGRFSLEITGAVTSSIDGVTQVVLRCNNPGSRNQHRRLCSDCVTFL